MQVESFIARRYLYGRKKFSFINIISFMATLGIMFGVAALIVVMSVFNGFGGLVTSILQDFDPHIKIEAAPNSDGLKADSVKAIVASNSTVVGSAAFIEKKALAVAEDYKNFVWIKGIAANEIDQVSNVREKVVLGTFDLEEGNGIVLGISLADKLHVLAGDTITIVSPAGMENILTQYVTPTIMRCPVVGIFDSQNKLYDGAYAFTSLATAQRLFRMRGEITGYEVRLDEISSSYEMQAKLSELIGPGWNILTWYDLHKDLYSVMTIERWSAFILLSIIIAVAVFNILASLTMLVLEKKRDIGVLRTLGFSQVQIHRIFIMEGVWIGLIGVLSGLVLGLTIVFLQAEYGMFALGAEFIIPALPVEVRISDIVIIVIGSFLMCLAAAWLPASRAKNLNIIDSIRWE
jgi:lipoprotein-releasing system permease protein